MKRYILAIDQSTSTTKAILFDEKLQLVCRVDCAHAQMYPQPGWAEHDPMEIYRNLRKAVAGVLEKSGVPKSAVRCLSISNQRETTLIWDAKTGLPVYNAIVWQCARAKSIVSRPNIAAMKQTIAEKTGLTLSPYFCAAKAAWLMENADLQGKELMFGTVDSWLIWKMTGNHLTDYSNASRTMLFNINTLRWDDELIRLFGLEQAHFPEVRDADTVFGMTTLEGLFDEPIPVAGVLGDSHGAMFGQQCWERGTGKSTFGTGTSVMMNIGEAPIYTSRGLATSIAWGMSGKVEYVLEGNINATGDTIKWLADELGLIKSSKESEEYANKVSSNGGVYLVPAFSGLGAPHYASDAKAIICGLSRNSNKYHITRAALESIAYQIKDITDIVNDVNGAPFAELRVDGGPTKNAFLMQFVADMTGAKVVCNEIEEISALGAACAGGLAVKIFSSRQEIKAMRKTGRTFEPAMEQNEVSKLYSGWKNAIGQACCKVEK